MENLRSKLSNICRVAAERYKQRHCIAILAQQGCSAANVCWTAVPFGAIAGPSGSLLSSVPSNCFRFHRGVRRRVESATGQLAVVRG